MSDTNPDFTKGVKYNDVAHCPRCMRRRMILRYPGNDPENGPPIKWCGNCGLEVEPCSYCELCFHEELQLGDVGLYGDAKHNSWGHGIPGIVDEVEFDEDHFDEPLDQNL